MKKMKKTKKEGTMKEQYTKLARTRHDEARAATHRENRRRWLGGSLNEN